jgi:signal peptide peptidase SppA
MPTKHKQDLIWAGTEAALDDYLKVQANIDLKAASMSSNDVQEEDTPYLLNKQGGVGVISIKGSLSNDASPWDKFFGATTYPAIREALVCAAQDPEIQQIMLDINSGGGVVNGVSDVGNLITQINDSVKPVTAYADGRMMSAAYWLGCSAGTVIASNIAEVGSIGVLATHVDQSQALKDAGLKVTVMRAGEYKALANSAEPLSDAAKKQIQASLDAAYEIFVQHVAEARSVTYPVADAKMAQGREFFGAQALEAGLVDGIASYDTLMSTLMKKCIDTSSKWDNNQANFRQEVVMPKKALTEQEIAAMAAGAPLTAAADIAPVATPAAPVAEVAAVVEPVAAVAAAAAVIDVPAKQEANSDVVALLTAQAKEANTALVNAQVALQVATEKLAATEAGLAPLLDIARKSVSNMQVALGASASDLSAATATAVLAEHARLTEEFSNKFKAGGVAAVAAAASEDVAEMTSIQRARLAAVRPTAKTK